MNSSGHNHDALSEVFNGVHVTFGAVHGPEVINDPQLRVNDIVVPLEGAGGKLTSTISSPIQVHGVSKLPAKRAPDLGQHNEEVLKELGFSATEVAGLYTSGVVTKPTQPVAAATKPGASPATASKPIPTAATA
jgi:formyl-CoA transferase